jgi:hypothetical protein
MKSPRMEFSMEFVAWVEKHSVGNDNLIGSSNSLGCDGNRNRKSYAYEEFLDLAG